jgi:hypothetical protein
VAISTFATAGLPALGTELPQVAAELRTLARPVAEGAQTATLDGKLTIVFGDVKLGRDYGGVAPQWSTLVVAKEIDYQKGDYIPGVCGTNSSLSDMLHTDKSITFGASVKVIPVVGGTAGQGTSWNVIEAHMGLVGTSEPAVSTGWTLPSENYTPMRATSATGKRFAVKKN